MVFQKEMEKATVRVRLPLNLINKINQMCEPRQTMAMYIRKCIEFYLNANGIKNDNPGTNRGDYYDGKRNSKYRELQ